MSARTTLLRRFGAGINVLAIMYTECPAAYREEGAAY